MELQQFMTSIGLSDKYAHIYLTLYRIGSSPASSVARQAGLERVYTYKALQDMVTMGIIVQTRKSDVTQFWIPDSNLIQSYIHRQRDDRDTKSVSFLNLKDEFGQLRNRSISYVPKIYLYEGTIQLTNLFDDIATQISTQQLLAISFFATHTFQEQMISNKVLSDYAHGLLSYLESHHISVHNYIAQGGLVMEHIRSYPGLDKMYDLPAGDNAINIIIVGQTIYCIIYKGSPVGIKIASPEFAWAVNFILQQTNTS